MNVYTYLIFIIVIGEEILIPGVTLHNIDKIIDRRIFFDLFVCVKFADKKNAKLIIGYSKCRYNIRIVEVIFFTAMYSISLIP